jgi:hypothetical protein
MNWGRGEAEEEEGIEKHFGNKKDDLQTTKLKKGKGWKMCNDELPGGTRMMVI